MNSVINNILGNNVITKVNKPNSNLLGNNVCTKVNENYDEKKILGENISTLSSIESDIVLGAPACTRELIICPTDELCPTNNPNCPSHRICVTDCPLDEDIIRYPSDKENKITTIADFIGWTEIEITGTKTKILKKKDIPTSHPLKRTYTDNQTIKYGDIGKIIG